MARKEGDSVPKSEADNGGNGDIYILSQIYGKKILEKVFANQNFKFTVRGEDLNIKEWILLAQALELA